MGAIDRLVGKIGQKRLVCPWIYLARTKHRSTHVMSTSGLEARHLGAEALGVAAHEVQIVPVRPFGSA